MSNVDLNKRKRIWPINNRSEAFIVSICGLLAGLGFGSWFTAHMGRSDGREMYMIKYRLGCLKLGCRRPSHGGIWRQLSARYLVP